MQAMFSRAIRTDLTAAMLLLLAVTAAARADEDNDHERVRAAREAGRILPLARLLARVQAEHPGGEVLEVELEEEEKEHGRLVYEIKLLRPGGHLAELRYPTANRGGWLHGLEDFFKEHLVPGALITLSATDDPSVWTLSYEETGGNEVKLLYKGKIAGDEIKFTRQREGGDRVAEFVAKRAK